MSLSLSLYLLSANYSFLILLASHLLSHIFYFICLNYSINLFYCPLWLTSSLKIRLALLFIFLFPPNKILDPLHDI